jgi:hypothetical protein
MTDQARTEADALAALYAAARPNETLPETVTRLVTPTFPEALDAVEQSAARELLEPGP